MIWRSAALDKDRPDLGSVSHNHSSSHLPPPCTPGTRTINLRTFWLLRKATLRSFHSELEQFLEPERIFTEPSIVQTANGPTINFKSEAALRYSFPVPIDHPLMHIIGRTGTLLRHCSGKTSR